MIRSHVESQESSPSPWGTRAYGKAFLGRSPPMRTDIERSMERGIIVGPPSFFDIFPAPGEKSSKPSWRDLPSEVWMIIFRHLPCYSLIHASKTCTLFFDLCDMPEVWVHHMTRLTMGGRFHPLPLNPKACVLQIFGNKETPEVGCANPFHYVNPDAFYTERQEEREADLKRNASRTLYKKTLYRMMVHSIQGYEKLNTPEYSSEFVSPNRFKVVRTRISHQKKILRRRFRMGPARLLLARKK